MNDAVRLVFVLMAVFSAGILGYIAIAVVTKLLNRAEGKTTPALPPGELEAIHERLAESESLEARVTELEERLDFAERLLAQQREPERLPSAHPLESQH